MALHPGGLQSDPAMFSVWTLYQDWIKTVK